MIHAIGRHYLIHGDSLEVLPTFDADSVDAIVSDPPYGLGFMGKAWDQSVPCQRMASELLRVLKPGGHALLFGGTRTYHRLAVALEDAGFEIRDCLSWLYGTGFPKSLDVSKAIDQARIEDEAAVRAVCRAVRAAMERAGLTSKAIADRLGYHSRLIDHWAARDTDSQPEIASSARWLELVAILPELAAVSPEVARLNARKGDYGEAWKDAPIVGEHTGRLAGFAGDRFNAADRTIREPSDAARQWEGWGTALKPAWEPILMARKPLIGTVAANVQAHGTGGINVDACRIGTSKSVPGSVTRRANEAYGWDAGRRPEDCGGMDPNIGRWPANVVLDEEAAAILDEQSGFRRPGESPAMRSGFGFEGRGKGTNSTRKVLDHGGGASRFFYVAKPSLAERDRGCDALPVRSGGEATDREDDSPGTKSPRAGSGRTGGARNIHPTVKPAALIAWLLKLVTPPGGVVLDPYCGSGTIYLAAEGLDLSVVGIERDPAYVEIALARGASAV